MTNTTAENQEPATLDLYGLLGVDRVASPQTIRLAYRDKAKEYHPDVEGTGNKLKFNQVRLARDVLLNPKSRANYDAVGVIDQEHADNATAELLTALTGHFGSVMHALLSNGQDPTKGDFVNAMQKSIEKGFDETNKAINRLNQSRAVVCMLDGRFRVVNLENPNHMQTIIEGQIAQIDVQIHQQHAALRQMEMARIALCDVIFQRAV